MKVQRSHRGFTLVEMLISITVLSLVMLATVTALRTLATTQTTLALSVARNDEIRSVSSFLRDALESAVVGDDSGGLSLGGGGDEATVFEVSPRAVMWRTGLLFGDSAGGSYVVRVALESARLVLRWQPMGPGGELKNWNNVPSRSLVENVQEFSVAYRREHDGEWLNSWDDRGIPPWLRLRIRAGERYWPDMVMVVAP